MSERHSFAARLLIRALLLGVGASTSMAIAQDFEFCGYPWPEPAPEYIAEFNRVERQRISLGYVRVCDRVFQSSDFQKEITPWRLLLSTLGFIPVDLNATPFTEFELIGGVLNAKIPTFADLPRTDHVTRVFKRKDGLTISPEEWDLTIKGGGVAEVYREPDVQVNGWPGYWEIIQTKSGKAYSSLWWQSATRKFELTINTNLKLNGRQNEILKLAASVPPGVPNGTKRPTIPVIGIPGVPSRRPFPVKPDS